MYFINCHTEFVQIKNLGGFYFMAKKFNHIVAGVAAASILTPIGVASLGVVNVADAQISNTTISELSEDRTATLTLHSYTGAPVSQDSHNGTRIDNTEGLGEARQGTKFKIYKVDGLNPSNFNDWKEFAKLNASNVTVDRNGAVTANTLPTGVSLSDAETSTATTGTDGSVTVTEPVGFYLVTQAGVNGGTTISPFFVSLPMTNPAGDGLNFDVHVYPKNQDVSIDKKGDYSNAQAGGTVDYTIVGDVAAPVTGASTYDQYTIVDRQPSQITAKEDTIAVTIMNGDTEVEKLTADDFSTRKSNTEKNSRDLIIELTESGRQKLFNAYVGTEGQDGYGVDTKVRITYTSDVSNEFGSTEEAERTNQNNRAFLYSDGISNPGTPDNPVPGDPDNPDDPSDPNDDSTVSFTNLTINKIDGDKNPITEDSATFQLYRCEGVTAGELKVTGEALTVGGVNSWTTENGTVNINGIRSENNVDEDENTSYCLVETDAPKGYVLRPAPFLVNLASASATADVENLSDDGILGNLPRTGGEGMIALIALGVVAAGGAGAVMASSNRKKAKANA